MKKQSACLTFAQPKKAPGMKLLEILATLLQRLERGGQPQGVPVLIREKWNNEMPEMCQQPASASSDIYRIKPRTHDIAQRYHGRCVDPAEIPLHRHGRHSAAR